MNMPEALARSDGAPLMMILIAAAVAVIKSLQNSAARGRLAEHFRSLAGHWGGTFVPGELFGDSQVRFELEGRPAILEYRGGRSPFTRLRVSLPDARIGGLRIARDGIGEAFRGLLDGPRICTGDRVFDGEFAVRAQSGALGRPE